VEQHAFHFLLSPALDDTEGDPVASGTRIDELLQKSVLEGFTLGSGERMDDFCFCSSGVCGRLRRGRGVELVRRARVFRWSVAAWFAGARRWPAFRGKSPGYLVNQLDISI